MSIMFIGYLFSKFTFLMEKHPVRGEFKHMVEHCLQQGMSVLFFNMALVMQSKSSISWFHADLRA